MSRSLPASERLRRRLILERTNAGYAALRANRAVWREVLTEREEWDVTLSDGLDDDPYPLTGLFTRGEQHFLPLAQL